MPTKAYRTGDLVRRNEDETFDYMGRKDSQIKLHGQRIELGKIESRMNELIPVGMSYVAETIQGEEDGDDILVALLWYTGTSGIQNATHTPDRKSHLADSHQGSAWSNFRPRH
jgi:hypothetical protein